MHRYQLVLFWSCLLAVAAVPVVAASMSPLLAWRQPVYIAAGFAGIVALVLQLFQPLLACGCLPGLDHIRSQRVHRWVGVSLVLVVVIHVAGLWFTSPPDVVDALLLRSPTPFSLWGVIAMWALIISGGLVALRRSLQLRLNTWRLIHRVLAVVIVIGSVVHAMLIDGTMEAVSKSLLCVAVIGATLVALRILSIKS